MILRELFYYDKETLLPTEDDRYDPTYDGIAAQAAAAGV